MENNTTMHSNEQELLSLSVHKLILCLALFVANSICGIAPLLVMHRVSQNWAKMADAIVHAITGGLFLGIGLLLLLPEIPIAEAEYREKYTASSRISIPSISMFFGILLMMVIDKWSKGWENSDDTTVFVDLEMAQINQDSSSSDAKTPARSSSSSFSSSSTLYKYMCFTLFISLHSLCEGFPMGYKKSKQEVEAFFVPLILHKCLEALSVGFAGKDEKRIHAIVGCLIHSSMTPVGAILGIWIEAQEASQAGDAGILILMGLSTGTILYLTFIEIIAELMSHSKYQAINDWTKIGFVFFGFSGTAVLAYLMEHE